MFVSMSSCPSLSLIALHDQFCIPTIHDSYVADIEVDGKCVEFTLCDIGGKDEYDSHRLHAYPDSHVILICFDIGWRTSFKNVRERVRFRSPTILSRDSTCSKWVPEFRRCRSGIPVLLVGCQKDTRRDPKAIEERSRSKERPVTLEEVRRYPPFSMTDPSCAVRVSTWLKISAPGTIWSAQRELVRASGKSSSTQLARPSEPQPESRIPSGALLPDSPKMHHFMVTVKFISSPVPRFSNMFC